MNEKQEKRSSEHTILPEQQFWAKQQHNGVTTILPTMEQPSNQSAISIRSIATHRNIHRCYIGRRRTVFKSTQGTFTEYCRFIYVMFARCLLVRRSCSSFLGRVRQFVCVCVCVTLEKVANAIGFHEILFIKIFIRNFAQLCLIRRRWTVSSPYNVVNCTQCPSNVAANTEIVGMARG